MFINISRKNSLILGIGIILLFFSSGILMLLFSGDKQIKKESDITGKVQPVNTAQSVNTPESEKPNISVPITMNKFERHSIKDGKKLWEVIAEKGRYIPQSNTAELEETKLYFYKKDDSVIQLTARKAKVNFNGTELTGASLSDSVEMIYNDKLKIDSQEAIYNKEKDLITIPGNLKITTENVDLTGKDLTAFVSKHEVNIASDVSTIIKPKRK